MTKESVKYNFSNAELMMLASNFVTFMTRDATEFATRNVTTQDITDFQTLGNAFEVFPADTFYQAQVTIEVNAKNVARASALIAIQQISNFFEQQWGLDSPQYKMLGIRSIQSSSDPKFLSVTRGVVTIANNELATLTGIGLTQTMIDGLQTDGQTMENKMNAVADTEATREIKTIERIDDGNTLYSFVQKYSKIGKGIWEHVNQAKFDNYIINPMVQSALGKVQNLAGVFIPASGAEINMIDLSWNAVATADGYEVLRSIVPIGQPSGIFAVIVANPGITYTDNLLPTIPADYYYKVRAFNQTATGAKSNETKVQAV